MSSSKSLFRFIVLVSLLCIICHVGHDTVWSSKFLVQRGHVLVVFTMKTTSGSSDFSVGFVHVVLHVLQQGTSLICFIFFLAKLFKCFFDDVSFIDLSLFIFCCIFYHLGEFLLFWRFPCTSYSRCVSSLSKLSPTHPSQGKLPSICPVFFEPFHLSFEL